MEFTLPDWAERIKWSLLCQSIPDFLKLYAALRALHGKKIHQTEAREIAVLYDAAAKGLDEWERKAIARGSSDFLSALDGYALLVVVLNSIVKEVDDAGAYHLYPFAASECHGADGIVADLQVKSGFARYTGEKLWERGLPTLSQLYIYGHCEPGVHKMHDDTKSKILDCLQLAIRVRSSGLQQEFSGRVKIFGCSSGKANEEDEERAFADVFAQRMRAFGYHDCEFFGYTEDLRFLGGEQKYTGHKYTSTKTMPYENTHRHPIYCEQVVQQALRKVYRKQAYHKMDEYEVLLKEEEIRESVHQARIEEARVWFRDNEKRASSVRVQF